VFKFLEKKGHTSGATVLKLLHNWHKAVDGRGLSEDQRSTYCEELKCWLLDDWMPWHREVKDYSQIDVNRLALLAASFVFLVKIKHVFSNWPVLQYNLIPKAVVSFSYWSFASFYASFYMVLVMFLVR
jgi:hypothetical protein